MKIEIKFIRSMNRMINNRTKENVTKGYFSLFSLKGIMGKGVLMLLSFLYCGITSAQDVGDHTLPLKYSVHTYQVTMGNSANAVLWNVYDSTATRERIDGGIDLPYSKTTDYVVRSQTVSGGVASIVIEFTGNLVIGRLYRLAYREENRTDGCYDYKFLDFRIQPLIDIDVEQAVNRCPDCDLEYLEDPDPSDAVYYPTTHSVLEYHVVLRNTDYNPDGGSWYFKYIITLTGQSGASATIDTVRYNGMTWAQPPIQATNSGNAQISVATKDVQFLVTVNDVAGVRQRVEFKLDNIEGAYSERDQDVITPLAGQNETVHYLEAVPAASYIAALD